MKLTEENYVELAEKAIKKICSEKNRKGECIKLVTTSKMRNLLKLTSDIYNDVINCKSENLSNDIIGRINYLKVRFVYEAGRNTEKVNTGHGNENVNKVKILMEEADILAHIEEIQGSRSQYILFNRYMEALVAYRKFYDDKDE